MSKVRVNYKSDLPPVAVKFKINGSVVDVPDHDFVIRFFVDGAPGTSFECAHKGDEYINCAKTATDTLTCYINNHKFGCGRLCCEFIDLSADSRYEDKVLKTVTPSALDVVLVEGAGDDNIEVLNIVFGYEINEIAEITAVESLEDGGNNVITITQTNGEESSFNVKNGNRGNGISSIEATESQASGGNNAITITETDGTETEFTVKNGKSAYQSYYETTTDVPKKTEEEWLASLKGADGVVLEGDPATLIADNLLTNDSQKILSARQGYVLKGLIDNIGVKSGTYTDALDAVLASNSVFEFLLVDEVDNSDLIKPLWHINGSLVDAAGAVVSLATLTAPTFSIDSGDVTAGTTVTITCPSESTLYYSVNGIAATSTTNVTITINEASVVKAYLKSGDAVSDIVAKTYGIAIDHRFQFKIKLTGDNSTEYIPVASAGSPRYTMTVDWGDGSTPSEYSNQFFAAKGCRHTYSGTEGDEFIITLRGSAIPYLAFNSNALQNRTALVSIIDNSLECDTYFAINNADVGGFGDCSSLMHVSSNALQNNLCKSIVLSGTALTAEEIEDGFFANIRNLTSCYNMFKGLALALTSSQWNEIKTMIKNCTNLNSMFYGFKGDTRIPDDFFSEVTATLTSVAYFTHTAKSPFAGDAAALYQSALLKVSESCSTTSAFSCTNLSNRSQVPSAWGGTGS